ncbi:cyclic peptide export ABC transporter [Aquimarina intermedia]|nr:cyclic peptide export ABC transporter [Aquimarina intermedia]
MIKSTIISTLVSLGTSLLMVTSLFSQSNLQLNPKMIASIDEEVTTMMEEGKIPGLSLVIFHKGQEHIRTYGLANIDSNEPVTKNTRFELGSNSKAFTALALLSLVEDKSVDLEASVSSYIPWFRVRYKDSIVKVKVKDLLYHTSGIPWETLSKIPETNQDDALDRTVRVLIDQKLDHLPGEAYEYATINYDILALIIEKVSNKDFETYLTEHVFQPLHLTNTSIGIPESDNAMSKGYKISFFEPRLFIAPPYKGNNAAGYVISNAVDVSKWMRYQINPTESSLTKIIEKSHERDTRVPLHDMSSYAGGWNVSLDGSNELYHSGLNPNYSSYININKDTQNAIAVLTNSNSSYTNSIANNVLSIIKGKKVERDFNPDSGIDSSFTIASIVLAFYCLAVLIYLLINLSQIVLRYRKYEKASLKKIRHIFIMMLVLVPYLYGIYLYPEALAGFDWDSIKIWAPQSFEWMIILILIAISLSMITYILNLFFPETDKFKKKLPQVFVISILTGLSGIAVIMLVTSAINSDKEFYYFAFYYLLVLGIYLLGRKFVQTNLIELTNETVYDLRVQIVDKIFKTTYHDFEKISRGRVYTTLTDDTNVIGNSATVFLGFITSIITAVGGFIYLASIEPWATIITISVMIFLSGLSYFLVYTTKNYVEEARSEKNVFMRLVSGIIDGYKEISMSRIKKLEYKDDISSSANRFREKQNISSIKSYDVSLVAELLLVLLLGFAAFGISEFFPNVKNYAIISFVMILLYLIGPINTLLQAIPQILQISVSWNRIKEFIEDIPTKLNTDTPIVPKLNPLLDMTLNDITFQYKGDDDHTSNFSIGPINLKINVGEILFIVGGNGSGKTTLAKLLTGLYLPDSGHISLNGKKIEDGQLSEYLSAVFNPTYLFEKLYNVDFQKHKAKFERYVELFDLNDKVYVTDENKYSTLNLSSGQRKRLALLNCFLEDSPIYLFDEWAADQDPEYRKFFYRNLLPDMKRQGKMIIVITHDDHYFDVADRLMKMERGMLVDYQLPNWSKNTVEILDK